MKYTELELPVCSICGYEDAAGNAVTKHCEKCAVVFCKHYASGIDTRYCANCMDDFKVVETIETKIVEHLNDNNEVTSRRKYVCKNLHLTGTDWLFTSHKINTLTEEELTITIEYHKAIASAMLHEREARRIEHFQKLSKVKLNFGPRPEVDSTGAIKKQKPVREKRVASSKSTPDANAVAAAFATLLGSKLSPEQVIEALAGLGKK